MTALPNGWSEAPIGNVARVVAGGTPNTKDSTNFAKPGEGIPWITPADLSGYREQTIAGGARDLSEKGFNSCSATLMPAGSVLFSSRAPIGYVAIASNAVTTNQGFKSFVLPNGMDPRFAYYQLKHIKPEAEAIATGTTFKELSGSAAATLIVKIAPTSEQKRIADKLDVLLTRVDACRDRMDRVPEILRRFKDSVRSAALRGKLTKAWRAPMQGNGCGPDLSALGSKSEVGEEDLQMWLADLPSCWAVERASSVVEPGAEIVYGIVQPGPKLSQGVPYVRGMDIVDGQIQVGQLLRTSPAIAARYARASIRGGDVLLGIIRATKVAVVPASLDEANITQGTARFRPSSKVLTGFLAIALEAPETQRWLHAHYRGIDMPGLNLADVRRVPVPLPPVEEQAEIVRCVESLFALADAIESKWKTARAQVERLTPALLAKAFRGELVPQDPNDEPASVLLERIAAASAERAALPKRKQQPRRPNLKPASEQSLLNVIDQMSKADFTFEELRQQSSLGYESLKGELFALLADSKSGVEQYFDAEERSMKLRRVRR